MSRPTEDRPAGLREPVALPRPRPVFDAVVAVVLGLAALAGLWAAVTGVGPARLDAALLDGSVEARTDLLTVAAVAVTHLGSTAAMSVLAALAGLRLWLADRRADAVFVIGATAGAQLVFRALKQLFGRPRPPEDGQLVHAVSESLPSGHATTAVVVIGALVVLAWPSRRPAARAAMVTAAALWVGAVGLTRVYLGVHWFSDVLAGWLVGAAWLALCVAARSRWRTRVTPRAV
ncbi:phosphatase PAP2 family protein [Pseudonocardia zijingensis]|jgi:undecaprenyl-diphosphatase|uniref:Phosphatidic acid phosphatase type 2/haloperoxidase domain-containing protein n=1 Tax=Pseudonocardia zijingensis TaxID=153376 RepID=A0ABP4AR29_9PSEU